MALSPPTTSSQPLAFGELGSIVLRLADNDQARRWGGQVRSNLSGTPVADLQRALTGVGLADAANGHFGPSTMLALRRFQWFIGNSRYRLRVAAGAAPATGIVMPYQANAGILVTGQCNAATAQELSQWIVGLFRTTSLLVRMKMGRFANTSRAGTFTTLNYPSAADDEVLVSGDFGGLDILDRVANQQKIQLRLNQTFRVQGVAPSGAVVAPATRSQHLVGHAVDLNIVVGAAVITSGLLNSPKAPKEATAFVDAVKKQGLRWGGDFRAADPPHFDQPVTPPAENYDMNFFFCQRPYAEMHALRLIGA